MAGTDAARAAAGFSFLLAPRERPDTAGVARILESGQGQAAVARQEPVAGELEIVVNGLTFAIDGLSPGDAREAPGHVDSHGFAESPDFARLEAFRLFPGHHLSGGTALAPVVRALVAVAAELAESLPVQAVLWHPAMIAIEPRVFSRSVLTWLAGGTFPAPGLAALCPLADGSVTSRGLAHFVGQEVTLRGRPQDVERTSRLAAKVVDRIVQTGPLLAFAHLTIAGETLCAEPAEQGRRIMVWPPE